jgi:hypothetical protein
MPFFTLVSASRDLKCTSFEGSRTPEIIDNRRRWAVEMFVRLPFARRPSAIDPSPTFP